MGGLRRLSRVLNSSGTPESSDLRSLPAFEGFQRSWLSASLSLAFRSDLVVGHVEPPWSPLFARLVRGPTGEKEVVNEHGLRRHMALRAIWPPARS